MYFIILWFWYFIMLYLLSPWPWKILRIGSGYVWSAAQVIFTWSTPLRPGVWPKWKFRGGTKRRRNRWWTDAMTLIFKRNYTILIWLISENGIPFNEMYSKQLNMQLHNFISTIKEMEWNKLTQIQIPCIFGNFCSKKKY